MDNEKTRQIIKEYYDEFISSKSFHEIIDEFVKENPPIFRIKGKGEEKADLAIDRIESQNKRLTELIQEYLTAVAAAKKNKRLPPEKKAEKLIPPLREIQKIIFPNYPKYHRFVDEQYINLEKELDLEKLGPNPNKYSIIGDREYTVLGLLNTGSKNIWISEELEDYFGYCSEIRPISVSEFERMVEEGKILKNVVKGPSRWDSIPEKYILPDLGHRSIAEIYPEWLPSLTPKGMASKDLLTQILVCYTIKRALNGDEKAIQKLCGLYENVAQAIAVKIGSRFQFFQDIDDMKQDALILLMSLIAGFRPDYILGQLLEDKSGWTVMPFPKWVKDFYVYYLSEYVPKRLKAILRKSGRIDRLIRFVNDLSSGAISITDLVKQDECAKEAIEKLKNQNIDDAVEWLRSEIGVCGLKVMALLNLYAPIQNGTVWKNTPKRLNRFNTYSFQPGIKKMGPRWNLTTWLLGRRNEIETLTGGKREDGTVAKAWQPYGKLYQLLRDKNKPLINIRRKTSDSRDDYDEEDEDTLNFENRRKALGVAGDLTKDRDRPVKAMIVRETLERVRTHLFNLGASRRNIDIYFKWKSKGTQSKIAKQYRLSERQIGRICKQIQALIPKVKDAIDEE